MPEQRDHLVSGEGGPPNDPLADRLRQSPGVAALVAEAEATWRARAAAAGITDDESAKPGWRAFEDSFPTFYEFTNRPR